MKNGKNMSCAGFVKIVPNISGNFILIADSHGFNDSLCGEDALL